MVAGTGGIEPLHLRFKLLLVEEGGSVDPRQHRAV